MKKTVTFKNHVLNFTKYDNLSKVDPYNHQLFISDLLSKIKYKITYKKRDWPNSRVIINFGNYTSYSEVDTSLEREANYPQNNQLLATSLN